MDKNENKDDFSQVVRDLISEQRFGEAINYLQKLLDEDIKNETALVHKELVQKILEYQNRDIIGSTNLDMDPWFE
jgi:predicted metal-dependent hydrolase